MMFAEAIRKALKVMAWVLAAVIVVQLAWLYQMVPALVVASALGGSSYAIVKARNRARRDQLVRQLRR